MVCSLAQALPTPPPHDNTKWVNCFGTVKKEFSTSDKKIKPIANFTGEFGSTPGKPGGKGVSRVYKNGIFDSSYEGEWKDGNPHGQGTETKSSHVYVGEWKDGMKNGQGTFTFPDGEKYVGEFKEGKFIKENLSADGNCVKGNCVNGQGTETFEDGREYVGEFKNDKFNGLGTFTYADGEKYVGEFKDSIRDGQATLTFIDGRKYVGEFKNDKFHGQGTFTFADGEKYVGEFKNGQFVK